MKIFNSIFLAWRSNINNQRHIVGVIKKNKDNNSFYFKYLITPQKALQIGVIPYTAFPDLDKIYTENVLNIFGLRLTRSERKDIQKYYDFWEISPEYKNDKWYLLACTQGMRATDNFEFLANYNPTKKLSFISEICGHSLYTVPPETVETLVEGDLLRWERDPNNQHDKYAVKVFKENTFLGFVKKIHSKVFYKKGNNDLLKIQVKSIDKNGRLNRVFIKIYMPDTNHKL